MLWKQPVVPLLTIEDFSDGTLSDFEIVESPWQIDTANALNRGITAYHPQGNAAAELVDTANHPQLQRGDTIRFRWGETGNGTGGFTFWWGLLDAARDDPYYQLDYDFGAGEVYFETSDGSTQTQEKTIAFEHTTGDIYECELDDTNPGGNPAWALTITNISTNTVAVSDSWADDTDHWSGGGFGWFADFGGDIQIDELVAER